MSKKILIVDDNEGDRVAMNELLGADLPSAEIYLLSSGEEAVDKMKDINPEVVILDTNLVGMNGFEACEKIRTLENYNPKIIVMTGLIDAVDAGRAREMGADDYCVKTADYADIIESTKNLLSG